MKKNQDKQFNLNSHSISLNIFWNLLGNGTPMLAALFAIPILIDGLGLERFGVLTLSWMVVGYFSLFDLGLGRALTKLVAEKLGREENDELPSLIWTALLLMIVLGIFAAVLVAMLSPWLVHNVLNIPLMLHSETLKTFYLLAFSIPIVIITTGLRGILEAYQRFGYVNVVKIPLGILTFIGPVAVLYFSNSLVPVIAILVIARLISLIAYAVLCLRVEPILKSSFSVCRTMVKPLLSFGGWITVSNIISPLMAQMDRFLIGAVLSMTAVSYYATPHEIITKFLIIPAAMMGVIFPAFATILAKNNEGTGRLYYQVIKSIFLIIFPLVFIVIVFAHDGLTLWLGSEFADNSTIVLQLLGIGIFINSHAQVPYGLIQAAGRADITAKLHLIELPFYLLLLWWLVSFHGIVGAAIAWSLRVAFDCFFLFVIAQRFLPRKPLFISQLTLTACGAFILLFIGSMASYFSFQWVALILGLLIFILVSWFFVFSKGERQIVHTRLKSFIEITHF
ncbi:flippase [Gammaproteobacteria bacterium]|nr:flippase [Gammaproteobacteria bacterium]